MNIKRFCFDKWKVMAGHNNHKFAPLLITVGILLLKSEGGCGVPDKFNMLPQCRHKFSARQKQKHFPFELIRDENAALHPLLLPHPHYSSLLPTIYAPTLQNVNSN